MIVWVFLIALLLLISYILAVRSMNNFRESAKSRGLVCSLYLVRNPKALSEAVLDQLYRLAKEKELIFSLEKLYRGSSRAVLIYSPQDLFKSFSKQLGLQELEDYTSKTFPQWAVWEVGMKRVKAEKLKQLNLDALIPALSDREGVWWQVVLQPKRRDKVFQGSLRIVATGTDRSQVQHLKELLTKLGYDQGLGLLPQAHSKEQLLSFYRERALLHGGGLESAAQTSSLSLTSREVLGLLS